MFELSQLQIDLLKALGGLTITAGLFSLVGFAIYQAVKKAPTEIFEKFL